MLVINIVLTVDYKGSTQPPRTNANYQMSFNIQKIKKKNKPNSVLTLTQLFLLYSSEEISPL
jgi:hypothetical protein